MIPKIKAWQVIVFLIAASYFLLILVMNERERSKRIESSFVASQNPIKSFTANDGKPVATTGVQKLTPSEIKTIYPQVEKEVKNLNLQVRRVQTVQAIGIATKKQIVIPIKDSIKKDTPLVKVQAFAYSDPYFSINGYIQKDSAHFNNIQSRDTLINVVYKERIKPWLWIFSPTRLIQVMENKNPKSKITYNQSIIVTRK